MGLAPGRSPRGFVRRALLLACALSLCAAPAFADGGSAILSGGIGAEISADERNCTLVHPADSAAGSYKLLLGRRGGDPLGLDVEITLEGENVDSDFQLLLPGASFRPISARGKAEMSAEAAYDAQQIEGDEYFRRLDEAELMDDGPHAAISEAVIQIGGNAWPDYVSQRRTTERFPTPRVEKTTLSYTDLPVLGEGKDLVESLDVTYVGPCKVILEVGRNRG
ncbi:MAG: hypothetical protein AB8B57_14160 [Congregibacter sp.]